MTIKSMDYALLAQDSHNHPATTAAADHVGLRRGLALLVPTTPDLSIVFAVPPKTARVKLLVRLSKHFLLTLWPIEVGIA